MMVEDIESPQGMDDHVSPFETAIVCRVDADSNKKRCKSMQQLQRM
jgi:hypothetical protein